MSLSSAKNTDKDLSPGKQSVFNFKEGEKVLCYHGPLIYFAKCMQARDDKTTGVVEYHIHYSGWNKSWDEWVPESRVLKINEENLQKQKDLHKAQKSEMGKKNRKKRITLSVGSPELSQNLSGLVMGPDGSNTSFSNMSLETNVTSPAEVKPTGELKLGTPTASLLSQEVIEPGPKRKKCRISESSSSQDDQSSTQDYQGYSFNMSDKLKTLLVRDWFSVDQNKKLVILPSTFTVDSIIDEYIQDLVTKDPHIKSSEKEIVKGVLDYFSAFINPCLLYPLERLQYDEMLKDDANVCVTKVFGVIHLLRLLVHFPNKLAKNSLLPKQRVELILTKLEPFIVFIESNIERFLSDLKYENASPDYLNRAMHCFLQW